MMQVDVTAPRRALRMLRPLLWAVLLLTVGCTTVAQLTSLTDENCRQTFVEAMTEILTNEGEKPDIADHLSQSVAVMLGTGSFGPRPFLVSSSSGADYGFFVQRKSSDCLLRLFSRQKGFTRYTNNLTYIATRQLTRCYCEE
ncbi:MAG TPA: hypothetical protein VFS39_08835 [Nitrospira sp.]|nr:hypothetical protein [Nitrospira sp.]